MKQHEAPKTPKAKRASRLTVAKARAQAKKQGVDPLAYTLARLRELS